MTFWNDVRNKLKQKTTACDITVDIYKKVASSGVNMLGIIKPSFYLGQMSVLTLDFLGYVENFLTAEDGDWGEYLKFMLYLRESSKRLLVNIQNLNGPLSSLINMTEEIFEGENDADDDLDDDAEPEPIDDKYKVTIEEMNEKKDSEPTGLEEINVTREDMASDYETLREELKVKIRSAEVPEKVVNALSKEIADVYQECIQLAKELYRLRNCPDGDVSTLLSILVDIQYGLCHEMNRHLLEDVMVEEQFQFDPGILTWTAHFLAEFSEKFNEEYKTEASA
ncbi:MAG: hypothetical protein LWY06_20315 [Firmicutes bacterium]|nr:hypothetical protein [Bacillota bacterium]